VVATELRGGTLAPELVTEASPAKPDVAPAAKHQPKPLPRSVAPVEARAIPKQLPQPKPEAIFVGRIVDESVADDEAVPIFGAKRSGDSPVPMLVATITVLALMVVVGAISYLVFGPKSKPAPRPATPQPSMQAPIDPETAAAAPVPPTETTAPQTEEPVSLPAAKEDAKPMLTFPSSVQFHSSASKAVLSIALDRPVTYQGFAIKNPDRLYFDLHGTDLVGVKGANVAVQSGLVSRIRISPHGAHFTRIVFDLHDGVDFHAIETSNPHRLTIELAPKAASPSTTPVGSTDGITIVIDPGHGGRDTGATSASGLREKDLTLDLAQRLGSLLEQRLGAHVIYTRATDDFISLERRVAIANESRADFLISIHGNSSSFQSVRGVETYYFQNSQEALLQATDTTHQVKQDQNAADARSFAADVHSALLHGLNDDKQSTRNRGLKTAPFVVLREAHMPAVLAEVAFISSSKDVERLESPAYRDKVAKALYQGIHNHVSRRDAHILSAINLTATASVAAR
jgi:N-acetylmuramoyl-L-alanine amidase